MIYVVKTIELKQRLGSEVAEALLCLLVRNLIYARREDLLPEFRDYAKWLAGWGQAPLPCPALDSAALRGMAPKSTMAAVGAWGGGYPPDEIFHVLVGAAAWNLLHANEHVFTRTDSKLADNVGWLDFTHALTFAEAAEIVGRRCPNLWPAALLQIACFIGRNAGYVAPDLDTSGYAVADPERFVEHSIRGLFDHGRDRFIVSVHLTKTLLAGINLMHMRRAMTPVLTAALNRFLHAHIKGRHVLRTARQMRELVEQE